MSGPTEPGTVRKQLEYGVDGEELDRLIDGFDTCRQFMRFECQGRIPCLYSRKVVSFSLVLIPCPLLLFDIAGQVGSATRDLTEHGLHPFYLAFEFCFKFRHKRINRKAYEFQTLANKQRFIRQPSKNFQTNNQVDSGDSRGKRRFSRMFFG